MEKPWRICYNKVNFIYLGGIMELGEKLKQARLEAGLSQRQLCGDSITRNMLSQIEHGTAQPSVDTLRVLAARLGKPVGWFLDREAVFSENQSVIHRAREAFDRGDLHGAGEILKDYVSPDDVYDRDYAVMAWRCAVAAGETAAAQGQGEYARECFRQAEALEGKAPLTSLPELSRARILAQAELESRRAAQLPGLDRELLLRAQHALSENHGDRAAALLEAAEDREAPRWNLLRGKAYLLAGRYPEAEGCLHLAEKDFEAETAPLLEQCCREQGDYRQAYFYACKQK